MANSPKRSENPSYSYWKRSSPMISSKYFRYEIQTVAEKLIKKDIFRNSRVLLFLDHARDASRSLIPLSFFSSKRGVLWLNLGEIGRIPPF